MIEIDISADDLAISLLNYSKRETVCLLDSCGVSYSGSHLLIAGIKPTEILEVKGESVEKTFEIFNAVLARCFAAIFTVSYDFGLKFEVFKPLRKKSSTFTEPDVFIASFDCLIVHDYNTDKSFLIGDENRFEEIKKILFEFINAPSSSVSQKSIIKSNFTRAEYLAAIEKIKEFICRGDTYQINLTQQFRADLPESLTPQDIFWNLRKNHPAPFSAFLKRKNDFVVSASPESFFRVQNPKFKNQSPIISASPIKGTRPRGKTSEEDFQLRSELANSEKDRAENVMIVDLLRNDLGRICHFGSVRVKRLCDLEEHPTFFQLVSNIEGELRESVRFSDILKAVFPCGSITGAPKISSMRIIDEMENVRRGLSMGAVGFSSREPRAESRELEGFSLRSLLPSLHLSVAIRTMIVKNREAIFNVGGGIVIDSVPEMEYEETLIKAKALINALNGEIIS